MKFHRFYVPVESKSDAGTIYKVKLTVKELNGLYEGTVEGIYRAYDTKIIEKVSDVKRRDMLPKEDSNSNTPDTFNVILGSLLDGVKDSVGKFYLQNEKDWRLNQQIASLDTEYMAAVEAGDAETAQPLVDEDLYDTIVEKKESRSSITPADSAASTSVVTGPGRTGAITIREMLHGVKERVSETTRMGCCTTTRKKSSAWLGQLAPQWRLELTEARSSLHESLSGERRLCNVVAKYRVTGQ